MPITGIRPGTEGANILREVWDSDFATEPTEESVVAGYISMPLGSQKVGNKMHLRKVGTKTAQTLAASSNGQLSNLTDNANVETEVTATPEFIYSLDVYAPHTLTRIIDDGEFRAACRKQLMAALNEQIDTDIFELFASLSIGTSASTDVEETQLRAALKLLAKNAKGKFKVGKTPVKAFFHVDEVDSMLGLSGFRSYDVRGNQGSAVSGQLVTTYGVNFEESGLVFDTGGTAYNGLILPDAFAIAYNIKPGMLPVEEDGLATVVKVRAEYAICEWFDSSGVKIPTSVA